MMNPLKRKNPFFWGVGTSTPKAGAGWTIEIRQLGLNTKPCLVSLLRALKGESWVQTNNHSLLSSLRVRLSR